MLKISEMIPKVAAVESPRGCKWADGESNYSKQNLSRLHQTIIASTSHLLPSHSNKGSKLPSGSETILLVEDDHDVREVIRRVLQRLGYRLLEAPNGQEALHLAARHSGPIHLLLVDVILPGMSGKTLDQAMKQRRPALKTLFISGYTDETIAHHGVLEPEVAFLKKPFEPATLARKVRAVLDG